MKILLARFIHIVNLRTAFPPYRNTTCSSYSPIRGHLGCFPLLAIMTYVAMNMHVKITAHVPAFIWGLCLGTELARYVLNILSSSREFCFGVLPPQGQDPYIFLRLLGNWGPIAAIRPCSWRLELRENSLWWVTGLYGLRALAAKPAVLYESFGLVWWN